MIDILMGFVTELWQVTTAMAPYLLFGFFIAGLLSVLVSPRLVEKHLGGNGIWPVIKSAVLGVPLPLCSCGVIPVAAGLRRSGASRAAVISFLISTPQTGVDSIMVTYSLLGPVFAIFRPIAAFVTGIIGGMGVQLFQRERTGEIPSGGVQANAEGMDQGWVGKARQGLKYGFFDLPQDIAWALVVGVVIAALVTILVPEDMFAGVLGGGIGAMLILMAAGIPMYVCATASVPIAAALMMKGVSPGAAFVFLVTGPATNAATISIVWKVLGKKTALIYLATVALGALAAGLLLDLIYEWQGMNVMEHIHSGSAGWVGSSSAVILTAILLYTIYRKKFPVKPEKVEINSKTGTEMPEQTIYVKGMTCSHCVMNVKRAIGECEGVENVEVDLNKGTAVVRGEAVDLDKVKGAVEGAGYSVG